MASSDLLLVTDGEIPRVSNTVLAKLEGLKQQTGMEIHGLLVGCAESESLDLLCTEVHDFLSSYETWQLHSYAGTVRSSSSALRFASPARSSLRHIFRRSPKRRQFGFTLHAKKRRRFDDDDDVCFDGNICPQS